MASPLDRGAVGALPVQCKGSWGGCSKAEWAETGRSHRKVAAAAAAEVRGGREEVELRAVAGLQRFGAWPLQDTTTTTTTTIRQDTILWS